jgi:hypothetical protein
MHRSTNIPLPRRSRVRAPTPAFEVPTLATFACEQRSHVMAPYPALSERKLADTQPIEGDVCDFLRNGM